MIKAIKYLLKYKHISKPKYLYYHNGNHEWTFKKIGPVYILVDLEYKD